MERWEIKADVTPEAAPTLDDVVKDLEEVLGHTLILPSEAEPVAWLNGLTQGVAAVSDLVLNPEDHDHPRDKLALSLLKIAAICIQFKKGL